mmetsp:Transcript_24484/g.36321  ORF Transcript_24484/g.36321 Transcript_24484/m.36321 type:complete len:715 (+) Transcript_24484:203-2347(+)|eukprot:CAMPEP_0194218564 /NCGR_PEP_ID=MMETSP0156-20130528/24024_1 /TAXON_ID=33649 /ORGANISM="Thalassionema nitzschioides, Strain L26-B" /LENGTH=714 /DNA_ID=CAMNT_0038947967 /DNA_START=169 /DNA_END=2313 /DNA_ORIENTATION=+
MAAYAGKTGYGAIESNRANNHISSTSDRNMKQRMECITNLRSRYLGFGVGCLTLFVSIISVSVWWAHLFEREGIKGQPVLYDYVVVGGGPSGITVATKLAKKLYDKRILLIEAGEASQSSVLSRLQKKKGGGGIGMMKGKVEVNQFDIPLLWSGAASREELEEGQKFGFKESLLSHHWPISSILLPKGIGGSGLVNAMIYVRCLPEDIQRWNLTGWTWETVQKQYYDLETYKDWKTPNVYKNESSQASWRGKDGPIVTTPSGPAMDTVAPLFLQSTLARGWPLASRGFNDPSRRVGASYYDFNIRDGIRHSIAEALLGEWNEQETSLNNLDVVAGAAAQEVLFDDSNGQTQTAVGVKYSELSGQGHHARLRNSQGEVILAGGSILTPQLLANSGIFEGGKVANLSGVGKNLHDHPVVNMVFELSPELIEQAPSIFTAGSAMEKYLAAVEKLKQKRDNSTEEGIKEIIEDLGTFATGGFSAGAFLTSPWAKKNVPDIQLTVFPRLEEPHVLQKFQQNSPLAKKFLNKRIQSTCMLVTVALLDPEARYEIIPDRKDAPQSHRDIEIKPLSVDEEHSYFNLPSIALPEGKSSYLTDHDVSRIAWGIEEVRSIFGMPPIAHDIIEEIYPGEKVTNGLLLEHVKTNRLTNSHWVGSAKMGRDDDPLAVVDEELRVRGVRGLRIVDASVIPNVPNGNTHSTVSIVASLAADLILEARMKR